MSASEVIDEETGEAFPDILTAEYGDFRFSRTPQRKRLNPQDVDKFFNFYNRNYGSYNGDDILLDLNIIPHIHYLSPGDIIFLPVMNDVEEFIKSKSSQARRRL